MKKLILLTSFFFHFLKFNCQEFNITKGKESEFGYILFESYIGDDNDGIYVRRTKTRGKGVYYYLEKLNKSTLKTEYKVDFKLNPDESLLDCFLKGGKVIFLLKKKIEKDAILLMREYKSSDGSLIGEIKQLTKPVQNPLSLKERNYIVNFSPDNSKMIVVTETFWEEKLQELIVNIYDFPSYNKVSSKTLINLYENSRIYTYDYSIDNEGRLFYLFDYMRDFKEEIRTTGFGVIHPGEQKNIINILPLENLTTTNAKFEFVNNKLILVGGFKDVIKKSEKMIGKEIKYPNAGVFIFFINEKTASIINKGVNYFTPYVIEKLTYQRGMFIKEHHGSKYYLFDRIIFLNNHFYLFEKHALSLVTEQGPWYYDEDYIVTKFDTTGKMAWMTIIPKHTANSLNSYNYLLNNNKIFLFYSTHPDNVKDHLDFTNYNPTNFKSIYTPKNLAFVCTIIEEDGTLKQKHISTEKELPFDPNPFNITFNSNQALLIRMANKKNERYDILKIK